MKLPQTSLEIKHFPVMLKEVLKICSPFKGGRFIDCTFGGGGYSRELLKIPDSNIIALDRDKNVNDLAIKLKKKFEKRFTFYNCKFSNLDKLSLNKVDAVIFDLGISSLQLDNMARGFSFKSKEKLDMSMGLSQTNAKEVINSYDSKDLIKIIKIFGDEKEAKNIVKNILVERSIKDIENTDELVKIINKSKRKNYKKKINVCTQTFQALRIFVNKEISELIEGIIKATKVLKPGGKLIVVSFHSLEDKVVKFYFKNFSMNKSRKNKYQPELNEKNSFLFDSYKNKILKASYNEIKINSRSRSAKLRVATRSTEEFYEPNELKIKFKGLTEIEQK